MLKTRLLSKRSGGRRLGLCRARHPGIGLRGCDCLTLCSEKVAGFGDVLWQRNFVAVRIYLIRFNVELDEICGAETRCDGNIGCVSARGHENSTEARVIVPCIKVDPPSVKKNLIPGAEISRTAKRLTDVSDMAGDIACWNIHAATKCDGEVLEIAADANSLDEDIRGGLGRSCGVVVEGNLVMHPVADGYRAFPSGLGGSELAVGDSAELVDFAIPARQEKLQNL
jgi:hypothetical protein